MIQNNKSIQFEDSVDFQEDWLDIQDYQLKILMLTSILAENNLAYRGTLKTMCEWLGVSCCYKNNQKIKQAIETLEKDGQVFCKIEGRTYHISISNKAFKNKRIIKIRKIWIQTFKNYNKNDNNEKIDKSISIDWIKILKVFVYIYGIDIGDLLTMKQISDSLHISEDTARKAINAIMECDLDDIRVYKKVIKTKYNDIYGNNKYHTLGTDIKIGYDFSDK